MANQAAPQIAYHWLRADMTAGSGNEPAWTVGEQRTITGRIALCERGYHSSPTPWQALEFAPGPVLCRVEISGDVLHDSSKSVSSTRKLLAARNVSRELRLFACNEAERALNLASNPDPRSVEAIRVARLYADGKATDSELDAAWGAARGAARAAAGDAAWDAAWDAARDAARGAAWAVAWGAARGAARAVAGAVAWDAAGERFNTAMTALLEESANAGT